MSGVSLNQFVQKAIENAVIHPTGEGKGHMHRRRPAACGARRGSQKTR
jgi:hypothetical protein